MLSTSASVAEIWQAWQDEHYAGNSVPHDLASATVDVLQFSDYVQQQITRRPELLLCLLKAKVLTKEFNPEQSPSDYYPNVASDESTFLYELRRFRNLHMLWLYWRDLAGMADLEETCKHVSWLADECLHLAEKWAHQFSCQRFGLVPEALQPLLIIAMGKYGAEELNVSSDIDLIFCYDDEQPLSGRLRALELFYTQVAQKVIQLLDQRTAEGFVFRVDMRLRPYGDSGPVVMSQSAIESYYLEQGRDWERFAMIKARFVTGSKTQKEALYAILKPFVFRRYVDFSVLEAPRKMKRMIESEIRRRNLGANIKLGAGGIREVEFFAQAQQLIHGGREPRLQRRELLPTLKIIAELGLVPAEKIDDLEKGYRFLRRLEHRLQAYKDQQTQTLPDNPGDCERLASSMGYDSWEQCLAELNLHRQRINGVFSDLFASDDTAESDTDTQFEDLWLAEDSSAEISVLAHYTKEQAEELLTELIHFKSESSIKNMGPRGAKVLDELMPKILQRLIKRGDTSSTLSRLTSLLHAIARRTAYLDLLNENSGAMKHLISLCGRSALIAEQLAEYPYVLDELLDPQLFLNPPQPSSFQPALRQLLSRVELDDIETRMDVLREFKQTHLLRLSSALCSNALTVTQLGVALSSLAETIIHEACSIAWYELTKKFGEPEISDKEVAQTTPGFGVIAYGKMGSFEMGFNSDLDLVFIYDVEEGTTNGLKPLDCRSFYIRLAQKIIHILSVRTRTGVLYEVDMRLRPSGNSGMLVSHIDAFAEYQREQAWTWEHQALIRARCVQASPSLTKQFETIRREILCVRRDQSELLNDVRSMRKRMRDHLLRLSKNKAILDLKQCPGGIADIEFLVQFWVLSLAAKYPDLLESNQCLVLLTKLNKLPTLAHIPMQSLSEHYSKLQEVVNHLALEKLPAMLEPDEELAAGFERVSQIWSQVFGSVSE